MQTPSNRYEILDGLRGVAAIMVVIFHLSEAFSYDPVYKHLNHGYLCVDFFFVLSGFVIGYAYQKRMSEGRLSRWDFLRTRLIRLQPMIFLSLLLGCALFYFQECQYYAGIAHASVGYVCLNALLSFFMIPITPEFNVRANEEMMLLNIPQWSMFFEYLANFLFCLFVFRLGRRMLICLVALFAVMLADSALTLNLFGMLTPYDYPLSLNAGWSFTPEHIYIGLSRVLYAFFGGLLAFRLLSQRSLSRIPSASSMDSASSSSCFTSVSGTTCFLVASLLIVAVVCMEQIGGYEHPLYDGVFNLFCTLLLFPLLVVWCAGVAVCGPRLSAVCRFLGRLSYPLYLMHYPLVYLFFMWIDTHHDAPFSVLAFTSVSVFLLSLLAAYAAMTLWDEPVRAWLTRRFSKKECK